MLDDLAMHSRHRALKRHQILFDRTSPGDTLVVIVSGRLSVTTRSADGAEFALTSFGAGDTIGELAVVDGGSRSADASADVDSLVVLIDREAVRRAMNASRELAQEITHRLAADLRRLTDLAADLVFLDLPRRVAKRLLELAPAAIGRMDLAMTQEELARYVGGTRQSVNAALRGFERRGWVTIANRRVSINDLEALSRFSG